MPDAFDFAVSGINHNHIYGQVDAMLGAGCRLTAFYAPEDDLAAQFAKRYPQAKRVADMTGFLYVDTTKGGRTGYLVEYGPTAQIFEAPQERHTQEYIRGEFS